MGEFKGTPGPWLAGDNFVYALNAEGVNRFFCGIQPGWIAKGKNRTPDSELAANARLIAAAPALLEALTAARNALAFAIKSAWEDGDCDAGVSEHVVIKKIDAAIRQATGGDAS